jgi:hypothetical protein
MQQETFIVGSREFTCTRMNAFAANKLLIRLQKIVVPVMGTLMSAGKGIGDIDVKEAAQVIAANLDESIMDNVIFPLFMESKVYCAEGKKFIKTSTDIDQCFTADNLFDLYELIFEVVKYQFSPFFVSLVERFGALTSGEKNQALSQAN